MSTIPTPTRERELTVGREFTIGIVERLAALRTRWLTVNLLTCVVAICGLLGCLWLLVATIDYSLELSLGVRNALVIAIAFIGLIGLAGLIIAVARAGNGKLLIRELERRYPDFGQRLRTVLDIHEGKFTAPLAMQRVLGNQTLARWETNAPHQMIAYQRLWRWLAFVTIILGGLMASMVAQNEWSLALRRSLGADIPYSSFIVTPGNSEVLEGTDVQLALRLEGRQGRNVSCKWRKVSDAAIADSTSGWIENELSPIDQPDPKKDNPKKVATYAIHLGKLRETVEYQFLTDVGTSETFRMKVRPLVQVTDVKTTVVPPAYTKAATRSFNGLEVTALAGSEVSIHWIVSQPLKELRITIEEKGSAETTVEASPTNDPHQWELVLPSTRTLKWKTDGLGIDGTPLEVAKGKLRIREDDAPRISWKGSEENIEVHTLAEVPLQVSVSDDFAVASAQIILQFADGDERVLAELAQDQDANASSILLASVLPLETLGLTQRDFLGYYAIAKDNCQPNPRVSSTDVRFIDIRPLRQYFREEEMMPGEPGGGPFASLEELTKRQRVLINQTRRLIKLPAEALEDQIKNIDKMVQAQSELAGNTAFLADFLVAKGNDDVESLRQAEAAMLQAADSLAAGTFETALLQEQDALRLLVETRNLLELLILNNPDPKMGKNIKEALASLRMKLRRTRPPTAIDIAAELDLIANEQDRTAKEVIAQDATNVEAADKSIEKQSELVQKMNELANQVSKLTWPSELIPQRMEALVKSIIEAESLLRQQQESEYQTQAGRVVDDARELAIHIRASNPEEPLETLAALSGMSQIASKIESELASTTTGESELARLSRRIRGKAETIEDVMSNLQKTGNNQAASEAAEQLEPWLNQAEFAKTLAASKEASTKAGIDSKPPEVAEESQAKQASDESDSESEVFRKEAAERSADYRAASEFMNDLYRQLASPKLEQLRKLEAKARQLREELNETTPNAESPSEFKSLSSSDVDAKAEQRELEVLLQQAGLDELLQVMQQDASDPSKTIDYRGFGPVRLGIDGVVQALRLEIQAIIQEQISTDRNIPVPQNYVEAIDRYFESISSPLEKDEPLR